MVVSYPGRSSWVYKAVAIIRPLQLVYVFLARAGGRVLSNLATADPLKKTEEN